MRGSRARGGSIVDRKRIHVCQIRCEQVGKVDYQTIADVHAQCDWARALARTELNVACNQALRRIDRNDILLQGVHHTRWVDRSETVINKDLIQRDHVSLNRPIAVNWW